MGYMEAVCTIIYGGFVAGNRAGLAYNMWPYMEEDACGTANFVPSSLTDGFQPFSRGDSVCYLFEDTGSVQFIHRSLAYTTAASVFATAAYSGGLLAAPVQNARANIMMRRLLPAAVCD